MEERAARLLDHTRYEVQQAAILPLPTAAGPARRSSDSSRPRSNSPPPVDDTWIRKTEGALRIGDHNGFLRTKVRRFLRNTCGLSQRTAQNLGDTAEYAVDAAMTYFLCGFSKAGKAAGFAKGVAKAAAKKAAEKVEVKLKEPRPPDGPRGGGFNEIGTLPGYDRHHPLADSVSHIPRGKAPAYHMQTPDHRQTASCGGGRAPDAYRAAQGELIRSGRVRDAMAKDIRDVRSKFGSKYNQEMREMLDYAKRKNYLPKPPQ